MMLDPFSVLSWVALGFLLVIVSSGVVLFVYDLKYMELPMICMIVAIVAAMGYVVVTDVSDGAFRPLLWVNSQTAQGLIGGAIGFVFFWAIVKYSAERWMGMGDAYIGLLLGILLGWSGLLLAIALSSFLGSIVGISLIMLGVLDRKSHIPYGPFLLLSLVAIFVFQWYVADGLWVIMQI
jgi:prepilin signal peptidase PulO-like enzyme (type II secretory pathway)